MSEETQNRNFMSPLRFDFSIDRLPKVNFFVQSANIPGISVPSTSNNQGTPFNNIQWQGDRIAWSDLVVDFKVDEEGANWYDIFKWMNGMSGPEGVEGYSNLKKGIDKDLAGHTRKLLAPVGKMGHIFGNGLLLVRNSNNNVILTIKFQDVWPTSLSELKFDTRDENVNEITCTATFKYDLYRVEKP